jgi:hypothetical protein
MKPKGLGQVFPAEGTEYGKLHETDKKREAGEPWVQMLQSFRSGRAGPESWGAAFQAGWGETLPRPPFQQTSPHIPQQLHSATLENVKTGQFEPRHAVNCCWATVHFSEESE